MLPSSSLRLMSHMGQSFEERVCPGAERALHLLLDAGVKVWMVTGNEPEAALQTAYARTWQRLPRGGVVWHVTPAVPLFWQTLGQEEDSALGMHSPYRTRARLMVVPILIRGPLYCHALGEGLRKTDLIITKTR